MICGGLDPTSASQRWIFSRLASDSTATPGASSPLLIRVFVIPSIWRIGSVVQQTLQASFSSSFQRCSSSDDATARDTRQRGSWEKREKLCFSLSFGPVVGLLWQPATSCLLPRKISFWTTAGVGTLNYVLCRGSNIWVFISAFMWGEKIGVARWVHRDFSCVSHPQSQPRFTFIHQNDGKGF